LTVFDDLSLVLNLACEERLLSIDTPDAVLEVGGV
jgi:hypothetical protein